MNDSIIRTFPSVFKDRLGCYEYKKFELFLKEHTVLVFCKPRVLPFSLKEKASKEIKRLIREDILTPIEASKWATPIVPVIKSDGTIRLCGDYKITLNKYLDINRYLKPRFNDLISVFQKAKLFSTLDLCQTYQQLPLGSKSQKLATISTYKGLFIYKRLPYGVTSIRGLLQRGMDSMLNSIEGVRCFLDDIVISE